MKLNNKVVLVTGANSGIGFAASLQFAKQKSKVIALDLSAEINPELAKKLSSLNAQYSYFSCDVSDFSQVKEVFGKILQQFGHLDILVNNAGILGPRQKTEDYPEDDFDKIVDVNIKGVYYFMKVALAHFSERKQGVIVNTASVAGSLGMAGHIAYSASKHAVMGMTKTAAIEYAKLGIRINAVCPGFTQTSMLDHADADPQYKEMIRYSTPMKRFGEAGEIADAILFLASDRSTFITGQGIILDGGLSVQ
ncbi:glucose 1-dehydrogenase [Emticicia sp. CRIBPO]|uniref:SDR family NAD(P)-dependent oxidoreductase n=1 Tax=Emticicia sp. CRIBPO TaxID=2683258 RepID=UPI001412003B|nr:SDR family NAD(P)-dependent oxidoreductase [Emticicia sp. CRIBPO]NBA88776.1 glucose 1-dehydrogenase [Emticicia sp. CRIBPO]